MRKIALLSIIIVFIAWVLFPFIYLIVCSFSTTIELLSVPVHWIPNNPTVQNYNAILTNPYILRAFTNSFIVSVFTVLIVLILGTLSSYSLARLQIPRRRQFLSFILLTQMLPAMAIAIPIFILMISLGLLDTHLGLIIVNVAFQLPFIVWILRAFFKSLPLELEDAAKVDGCSRLGIILRIILPLSLPGVAAASIFSFIGAWNALFFPLILTENTAKTMTVIIAEFSLGELWVDQGLILTAGVIGCLPVVILALVFETFIVRGLTAGAVKG